MSPQLDQALKLMALDPPPEDLAEQIDALAKAAPASEAADFGELESGLYAAGVLQPGD